jgi:VanZ family protein
MRRGALIVWAAAAAFCAYLSLVPFNFDVPARLEDLGPLLAGRLETRVVSRINFAANALLFVPMGVLGMAALAARRASAAGRLGSAAAVLALCGLWSVAIEAAQALLPTRTPSTADVLAQVVGASCGAATWPALSPIVATAGRSARLARPLAEWLLGAFVCVRTVLLLLPLDVTVDLGHLAAKYRAGGIVINPMRSTSLELSALPMLVTDILFAVPIGLVASLWALGGTRRAAGAALVAGAGWGFAVELAQVAIRSRTADIVDALAGLAGVALGVLAAARWSGRRVSGGEASRLMRAFPALAAGTIYLVYHWSPFDFSASGDLVRGRLQMLAAPPFQAYYVNPELAALGEVIVKLAVAGPIGAAIRWWASTSAQAAMAAAAAVGLFALVEVGQVALPSRYPDGTDVILAVAGAAVGWTLTGLAVSSRSGVRSG